MEAFGDPSERAWVAGKAIVMFEGRHQFEELPVLRRRGKQKEKGYRHKVFFFFLSVSDYLLRAREGGIPNLSGTRFMEHNFSTNQGRGYGLGMTLIRSMQFTVEFSLL